MERISSPAGTAVRARENPVDTDSHNWHGRVHSITENQLEGGLDPSEPLGPVGLDLSIFDSLGAGNDLREPFALQCRGDDIHGGAPGPVAKAQSRAKAVRVPEIHRNIT